MKDLIKSWEISMRQNRQEADSTQSYLTRLKCMTKFMVYRDCIKQLKQQLNEKDSSS